MMSTDKAKSDLRLLKTSDSDIRLLANISENDDLRLSWLLSALALLALIATCMQ